MSMVRGFPGDWLVGLDPAEDGVLEAECIEVVELIDFRQ